MGQAAFYPKPNQSFGWILWVCAVGLLLFIAPAKDVSQAESASFLLSLVWIWRVSVGVVTLLLSVWISRAFFDLRPWIKFDNIGVSDQTPMGLGRVPWEELMDVVIWNARSEKCLGFILRNPIETISARPWPVRLLLHMELLAGMQPLIRIQGRGFKDSLDPMIQQIHKHLPNRKFRNWSMPFGRAIITMIVGSTFLVPSYYVLEEALFIQAVVLAVFGYTIFLSGIVMIVMVSSPGSRIPGIVTMWSIAVVHSWGGLFLLDLIVGR